MEDQGPPARRSLDPFDSDFDSGTEDTTEATLVGFQPDYLSTIPALRRVHVTDGYRAGVIDGKEAKPVAPATEKQILESPKALELGSSDNSTNVFSGAQIAFDESYPLGAELGLKIGWILGVLEGLKEAEAAAGTTKSEKYSTAYDRAKEELTLESILKDVPQETLAPRAKQIPSSTGLPATGAPEYPRSQELDSKVLEQWLSTVEQFGRDEAVDLHYPRRHNNGGSQD